MDKNTLLADYINAIVKEDAAAADEALRSYVKSKSKSILSRKNSPLVEHAERFSKLKIELVEYIEQQQQSAVQLDGDKIMVNGKFVGTMRSELPNSDDPDEWDKQANHGIDFVSADGKFSKEFEDIKALFQFITTQFLGAGHV